MSRLGRSTKLDLINSAISKISISGITAPAQPDDFDTFLNRLEGLMYEYEGRNVCTNYNFTEEPDPADYHGMEYSLFEPISNILAVRVLHDYQIPATETLLLSANAGISSVTSITSQLRETQYPRRQPRGAGNTLRYNRWQRFYRKPARVRLNCDTIKLDTDEINDYSQSWISYLRPNEDLQSFASFATEGVGIISAEIDGTSINYRLEGLNPSIDNGVEQVRFRVTTTTGRIDERIIDVEVLPITTEPERFDPSITS